MSTSARVSSVVGVSLLLIVLAGLVQVGFGAYGMGLGEAWQALFSPTIWSSPGTLADVVLGRPVPDLDTGTLVVWTIRLPRTLAAVLVGAALAVSGAVFQGLTRNELASPYILGVSAGAGLAALLVLVFASALLPLLPLVAAAGGGLAFLVVYGVAWKGGGASPVRLILAGVVVATILGALQTGLYLFADDLQTVHSAIAWTTGSMVGVDWAPLLRALPWLILGLAILLATSRQLDVMALGDRAASALGMRVERVRFMLAGLAVLLAAGSVTIAGTVGFLGLIVPHVARTLVGSRHGPLLIASAAVGAALLAVADTAARLIFNPVQVPVGILTGLVGGVYFLYLMRRRSVTAVTHDAPSGTVRPPRNAPDHPPPSTADITVQNLELGYGDQLPVISRADLTAPAGKVTVLVGPNGSGKSTLLRGIARQLAPRQGSIYVDGVPLHTLPSREFARRLAFMQQEHEGVPELTVGELALHGRHPYRKLFAVVGEDDRAAVDRALALAGVEQHREASLRELSGGQRQLAWLALCLAQETDSLLLDEPTTFLDLVHQFELLHLLQRLADDEGITIVAVLHDLAMALRFADHLVVLQAGEIVASGAPETVLTPDCLADVFGVHGQIRTTDNVPELIIHGPLSANPLPSLSS